MNFSGISDKSTMGKLFRFPLRFIPSSTRVPILQGPLQGKRWIVGSGTHGCWIGSYEHAKQRLFAAQLKRGYTVYDLGANVGFYSLLASVLVGSEGHVYSFEPVERNLRFLRSHLKLNCVTNCSVLDVAVGNSERMAAFDPGPNYSSGHLTDAPHGATSVRVVTLDGLVAAGRLQPPHLIKCDIEGAEYDALCGARNILAEHAPVIFLATHGHQVHQQCCKLLADYHYQLTSLDALPLNQTREVLAIRHDA